MMSALNDKPLFCAIINGIFIQLLWYLMNMVAFEVLECFLFQNKYWRLLLPDYDGPNKAINEQTMRNPA